MKTATISGVPPSIQRDSWWMGNIERGNGKEPSAHSKNMRAPLMLLALVALADAMVWQVVPGLSLAVLSLTVIGAACLMARNLPLKRAMLAGVAAIFAVAPVIELVQPLSILLLFLGLSLSLCLIAGVTQVDLIRASFRYPILAPIAVLRRLGSNLKAQNLQNLPQLDPRRFLLGWGLPIGFGGLFLVLLTGANPVLEQFFDTLSRFHRPEIDLWRFVFWAFVGLLIYAALIASTLFAVLSARRPQKLSVRREGLINATSVTRSLVMFNALFAVQTGMDVLFLYGGTGLPEGMSYAQYAHRGAYPLLATALLAGLFAVLARPYTDARPVLRAALIAWLVQTLALVAASITRLEIYVDVYGLTRLRAAAAIWMAVVALGLGLVIWQVQRKHQTIWMLRRCVILGLSVLYVSAFVNFDRAIAWYNITRDVQQDRTYICSLSEGVIGPIWKYYGSPRTYCAGAHYLPPAVFRSDDWREWGFRNWRLRTSLATLETEMRP